MVTVEEVAELTGQTFTATQEAQITQLITMLQAELETYCNRPLTPRVFTGEVAKIGAGGWLFLHNTPVVSIDAVTVGGAAYTPTYELRSAGAYFSPGVADTVAIVDYTAGLDTPANAGAKALLLARLSRIVSKVHDDALGVSSLTQEGYTAAYLEEGWTEQELKAADRFRRRVVRT